MNPLNLVWRAADKAEKPVEKPLFVPMVKHRGVVTRPPRPDPRSAKEVAVDQGRKAKVQLKVQVQAVSGHQSGTYNLAYQQGQNLEYYLQKLGLKMAAIKNRVYDQSNLGRGPIRLTYCPTPESDILITGHKGGSAYAFQRAGTSGDQAARLMAARGDKEITFEVERPVRPVYRMKSAPPLKTVDVEEL